MKIGIFDSGLGGLLIAKQLVSSLPDYDYLYYGDTANLPYGDKTQAEIYRLTLRGVEYLLQHECQLVIIACNTASAEALRKIQQQFLPQHYPDRKVLGVIIPTVEVATSSLPSRIGILATQATVDSKAFIREIRKLSPKTSVYQQAAPGLVEAIEANNQPLIDQSLDRFLRPLLEHRLDCLILGSTHYAAIKADIVRRIPSSIRLIAIIDTITDKLVNYLSRHPEIAAKLSRGGTLTTHTTAGSNIS